MYTFYMVVGHFSFFNISSSSALGWGDSCLTPFEVAISVFFGIFRNTMQTLVLSLVPHNLDDTKDWGSGVD